jgi:hypothetical protein
VSNNNHPRKTVAWCVVVELMDEPPRVVGPLRTEGKANGIQDGILAMPDPWNRRSEVTARQMIVGDDWEKVLT